VKAERHVNEQPPSEAIILSVIVKKFTNIFLFLLKLTHRGRLTSATQLNNVCTVNLSSDGLRATVTLLKVAEKRM